MLLAFPKFIFVGSILGYWVHSQYLLHGWHSTPEKGSNIAVVSISGMGYDRLWDWGLMEQSLPAPQRSIGVRDSRILGPTGAQVPQMVSVVPSKVVREKPWNSS